MAETPALLGAAWCPSPAQPHPQVPGGRPASSEEVGASFGVWEGLAETKVNGALASCLCGRRTLDCLPGSGGRCPGRPSPLAWDGVRAACPPPVPEQRLWLGGTLLGEGMVTGTQRRQTNRGVSLAFWNGSRGTLTLPAHGTCKLHAPRDCLLLWSPLAD